MLIQYAILGLLDSRPLSGYDLKKIMQNSEFMYWSGNNNQIYKALLQLCNEGLITSEAFHQEGAPSKKVYSMTEKGRETFRNWVDSMIPEAPEYRKPFLIQLACAGTLEPSRLQELLLKYAEELNTQLVMQQEKERRSAEDSGLSKQERFLEKMIAGNIRAFYQSELDWARQVLKGIQNNYEED